MDSAHESRHWFEDMADHMGEAYLRYSFTRGTEQEVEFLIGELGMGPGTRVLDVGCGPGRHAHALARRGIEVHGVDISDRFIELARSGAPHNATFSKVDARNLVFDAEFDAAISLCQGAFGLCGLDGDSAVGPVDPDGVVLAGMARALKPGGLLAVSAFSAYFQIRYLEDGDAFDADRGVNHERTELVGDRNADRESDRQGPTQSYDLWTSCFTPRELRLMARAAGLEPDRIYSVTPGRYSQKPPGIDDPEFLLVAAKPA